MLQNFSALFFFLFNKNIFKFQVEYIDQLMTQKTVTVGYKDDVFALGSTYKVHKDEDSLFGYTRYSPTEKNKFNGHYADGIPVGEKVFKFIPTQKYRKIKLQKLHKLSK